MVFFFLGSYVVFTQSISFEILCLYVNKKSKAHLYLVAIYSAVKEAGRDTVCYGWPADMDKSSGLARPQEPLEVCEGSYFVDFVS